MMTTTAPAVRPANACFSSGPCAKRPGWTPTILRDAALGRSHRAKLPKAKLKLAIDLTRELLGVPDDYRIGITPGSDTGAFEMAMWSMLGERAFDELAWASTSTPRAPSIDHMAISNAPVSDAGVTPIR